MIGKTSAHMPAAALEGLSLAGGWKVQRHLLPKANATGGTFSHSYIVENGGRRGFLKAFDFSEAFRPGRNTMAFLLQLTSAYEHEREVLQACAKRRLSNVVVAIDHGDVQVPDVDGMNGRVFYLIFELADGDIRAQVDEDRRFDALWSLRALKDVCLGLWQVHKQMIAHQDMKPSNVLVYGDEGFRIADFGRSSQRGRDIWYNEFTVAGDRTYSPPELLYGFTHTEFTVRRFGCDLYMLGNLAAFMFSGVNVTASLLSRLDSQFHPETWHGTYNHVLPYVQRAFTSTLQDLETQICTVIRADIVPLIRQLCNPDPAHRGHPRGIGRYDQHSLERYVSQLDLLCRRAQIRLRFKANKR